MSKNSKTMTAAVLTGFGGLEKLEIQKNVTIPTPLAGEVLIRVEDCGLNNTDINTRAGWYNKSVRVGTTSEGGSKGFILEPDEQSGGLGNAFKFPRIQGADVAGVIVDVGDKVKKTRIGERVLVDPLIRPNDIDQNTGKGGFYLGNGIDGGFAEYTKVPSINAIHVNRNLSFEELATFPCSSSTAELMLTRGAVDKNDVVVITGATGGVGSAAIQLAKHRGSFVIGICSKRKVEVLETLKPDKIITRDGSNLHAEVANASPSGKIDVVIDVVGGEYFPVWINALRPGGRYVASGAIAGPIVELDMRSFYLKDLTLIGATHLPADIFLKLVDHIENKNIKPLLGGVFPLTEIQNAQKEFMKKEHLGNLVIVPS